MRIRARVVVISALVASLCSGCAEMSQFCYRCSCAFDPAFAAVPPGVCGHSDAFGGDIDAVDYAAPVSPVGSNLRAEIDHMQRELTDVHAKLADLNQEVLHRNQALIDARSELGRMQADVSALRENVTNWELGVNDLRHTMNQRNEQRLREIRKLSSAVERLGLQQATAIQQLSDPQPAQDRFDFSGQFR